MSKKLPTTLRKHEPELYQHPLRDGRYIRIVSTRMGTVIKMFDPSKRSGDRVRPLTKKDVVQLSFCIIEGCYATAPSVAGGPVSTPRRKVGKHG